jgi:hypothetical protein
MTHFQTHSNGVVLLDYAFSNASEPPRIFEPDILVEPRFYQAFRRENPRQPERALLFAVLSEAIETFQKCAFSQSPKRKALFREAEAWIWDEKSNHLVSFKNICQLMGLDPTFLRRGLLKWETKHAQGPRKHKSKKLVGKKFGCRKKRVWPSTRRSVTRFRRPRPKGGWLT